MARGRAAQCPSQQRRVRAAGVGCPRGSLRLLHDSVRLRGIAMLGYTFSSKPLDPMSYVSDKYLEIFTGFLRKRG